MTGKNNKQRQRDDYSEPREYNNDAVWKEHASIREEIGALKQAGEYRDKRIEEIKKSVDNLSSNVDELKKQIGNFIFAIKLIAGIIAVAGAIAGIISAIPAIKAISVPMEIPKSDNLGGNQNEISENGIRHSVRPQTSIMKARRY